MTDDQKAEIERLAGAHHDASVRLRHLGMMNIVGFTAEQRRRNAIAYAVAAAEENEARRALDHALYPTPQFEDARRRVDAIFNDKTD